MKLHKQKQELLHFRTFMDNLNADGSSFQNHNKLQVNLQLNLIAYSPAQQE